MSAAYKRVPVMPGDEPRIEPIKIVVYGLPAPQGSKKYLGQSNAGHAILGESSAKVRPWRSAVKEAARAIIDAHARHTFGGYPLDCPLWLSMVFTMPKPASSPKSRRTYACKKPDLSKLARSTEDALTDSGLIKDDARIVEYLRLAKVFPGEDEKSLASPGVRIEIFTQR